MQTLTTYLPYTIDDFPVWISAPKASLLCDIETCGFSARTSMIYMIGCGAFEDGSLRIDQYFAENTAEEAEILRIFLSRLSGIAALYTFNGSGFDLPFLKERMRFHHIDDSPADLPNCDLFKEVSSLKKLLHLENYKQKSVEKFFNFQREDTFQGGELIDVYKEYLQAPDPRALNLLFLHNREDLAGMAHLLPLFCYQRFFQGPLQVADTKIHTYPGSNGEDAFELLVTLKGSCRIPVRAMAREDDFFLTAEGDLLLLRAPILQQELKYYYPDYKNYYYLEAEDRAIHKSIASSVDPAHRKKCKASNCYTRKSAFFLPQNQIVITPDFYTEFRSHPAYFEMTAEFFLAPDQLLAYCRKIIEWILE